MIRNSSKMREDFIISLIVLVSVMLGGRRSDMELPTIQPNVAKEKTMVTFQSPPNYAETNLDENLTVDLSSS